MISRHQIFRMAIVHPHAPVIKVVDIKEGDRVLLLKHPHLEIPKDVGHRLDEALIVRVGKDESRAQNVPELAHGVGRVRLQNWAGVIADPEEIVGGAIRHPLDIGYRTRTAQG